MNGMEQFECFLLDGHYGRMKATAAFLDAAKAELRQLLEGQPERRIEYSDLGMVAKFVPKPVSQVNQQQLIEDLSDYVWTGELHPLIQLDPKKLSDSQKEELAGFLLPAAYYAKPSLNKKGKAYVQIPDILFGGQSEEELVAEIRNVTFQKEGYSKRYEEIKEALLNDLSLRREKKIKRDWCSFSYVEHKPAYDMERLLAELPFDFIIEHGKVQMTELKEWIERGRLSKSVLKANQELVDLQLSFVVLSLESERKMLSGIEYRRNQLRIAQ